MIENCKVCEYGLTRCMLCNDGYFLEESFNTCSIIDQTNNEYKLA